MGQLGKILNDEEGRNWSDLFKEPAEEYERQIKERIRRRIQTAKIREEISKEGPAF